MMAGLAGRGIFGAFALSLLLGAAATGQAQMAGKPPAFVYVNARVYTGSGWATAVGVSGGRIVAVGDAAAVRRALPADVPVVDLKGRTVFPGLHDAHVHPISAGKTLRACAFDKTARVETIVAAVAACAKRAEPGAWIYGGEWAPDGPDVKKFNKALLDAVAPDNPVALADTTGHDVWANSRALAAGGFTRESPDPSDGKIERDASREPTGMLREGPAAKLRYTMPAANVEEATGLLGAALEKLPRYGITAIVDAAVRIDEINAYDALADAGKLKLQVRGCILWNKESPDFDRIYAARRTYERPRFRLDCVKVFMDGAPNDSHTAAMLDPYMPTSVTAPVRGDLIVDPAKLREKLIEWDKAGMVVKIHAGGDRAVHEAINAIAAARAANGPSGPRHEVVHNPFITKEDLARAKQLGIALEFSPVFWYPTPLSRNIEKAVGPARSGRAWPVREGIASGALVFGGSDWPAIAEPNLWLAIETLVTRRAPGGTGPAFAANEAITLRQAVDMFTRWPAQAFRRPGDDGTIHPGAPADLVVLDRNPFQIPITQVHAIRTLRTIAGGETIYDSGDLPS